jgi:hypothetical protein
MVASYFQLLLYNWRQAFSEFSRHDMPREAADQELQQLTKQDFGDDYERWEEWGRAHDLLWPGT